MVSGNDIREKYLEFMKKNGHEIVPSSALIPENDPTTLFTGSGMQPMVPYLLGEEHPKGTRIADSQKCFRAEDIEDVGDNRHTTFFEMLGNWSLGDYFKEEQLKIISEFLFDEIGLNPENFYVTAFRGDEDLKLPQDTLTASLWQNIFKQRNISNNIADMGSSQQASKRGIKENERIFYYDAKENWWSRAGIPGNMPIGEIGGGDSEMFYDFGTKHNPKYGEHCHPACDCGRFLEIGNSVFMEYIKAEDGSFQKLPKQNVDFGGGLERITAAVNNQGDVFKIDLLWNTVQQVEKLSGKKYEDEKRAFRIITDHIRGAVFMIGDGVPPSSTEQGYFVRRLLRRAVRFADILNIPTGELKNLAKSVINTYKEHYHNLSENQEQIIATIAEEENQFRKTLSKGMREFEKIVQKNTISGHDAFILFTTYGFPYELTEELAQERNITIDKKTFDEEMKKHQSKSRAGAEQKFKGGLADQSDAVVQYHTLTHLLLAGLRKYLGEHVHQAGSNITGERLRFDFTHPEKIDKETLDKIESFVNDVVQNGGDVFIEVLSKEIAQNDPTIEGSFWDRYPNEVKVYTMKRNDGTVVSRELCGGPHVKNISEIKGQFKIKKESSSSAGVRRIKAVLIPE